MRFKTNYLLHNTLLVWVVLLTTSMTITAQSLSDQLRSALQGKTRLAEIMPVVDSFYATVPDNIRDNGGDGIPKLKHWKRWEWYMARRLDANGDFVHVPQHNLDILRETRAGRSANRGPQLPGEWTSIGMTKSSYSDNLINSYANGTGRIDRIAFHPWDTNIIYVGTPGGGLWRTTNGGNSWDCLTDTLPSIGISGVVVSRSLPSTLYILTGTGDVTNINYFLNLFGLVAPSLGVYKSINSGETWTPTGSFPATPGVKYTGQDLVQNPVNTNTLLAATSDGIFRTTNGGTTWTKVRHGLFFDLEYKPGSNNTLYAAKADSILYSTNDGVTWTASALNVPPSIAPLRIALGTSPANPSRVYALFGGTSWASFSGVYRSENSGVSFTRKGTTPNILGYSLTGNDGSSQAEYDLAVAVDPANADRIILSGINVWTSSNGGDSFTNLTKWYEDQPGNQDAAYIHCDHHAAAYQPISQKLFACSDGGIYWSSNHGDTWTDITDGLVLSQFYHLSQKPSTPYQKAGGLQDNGVKFRGEGVNDFIHMYGADGFSTSFVAGNSNEFYSSINASILRINYLTGDTPLNTQSNIFFAQVLAHPVNANIVFSGQNTIRRSTNQGSNWTNQGAAGSWGMAFAPSDPTRMYAAGSTVAWSGEGEVYTSTDEGVTWSIISNNPGFPATFDVVTDLAVHPTDPLVIYVTLGGLVNGSKVYRSTNGGASWSNLSFNLPNLAVHSIVLAADKIFVGNDLGVYHLPVGQSTWTDVGDNLPNTHVTDLLYDAGTGILTAATFGRGVWERKICVDDITLTYPLEGALKYSCNDELISSSDIPGNAIDSVDFRAFGKIKLLPGFKVGTGGYLKAKIEACDNGNIPLQAPTEPDSPVMSTEPKKKGEIGG
jgi:photosystem II stability/assembly factor-like uncharacterized protein